MAGNLSPTTLRALKWSVLLGALLLVAGASGCWKSTANKAAQKLQPKKPVLPLEELRVFTEPNERSSYDAKDKRDQRVVLAAKPGHWAGVLVQGRANLYDYQGVLRTTAQDANQRPIDLERSPFWISTERDVTLPKAQQKTFETLFFPPRPAQDASLKGSTWVASRLLSSSGKEDLPRVPELVSHMPSYQYFMVVLSGTSSRYEYLNSMASVHPLLPEAAANVLDEFYYRVLFPKPGQPLALSTQSLCWTSTACVLWDDLLPNSLSIEQQRAMLDWLHWGGLLIVSGPDSLDKLRGSFLDPYLPVSGIEAGPIDPAQLAELHTAWSVLGDNSQPLGSNASKPWSGITLKKHEAAEFVSGTGQLVAQWRVGRGRIAVTAFRLTQPDLVSWPSYDSFFNACLLGHPAREFSEERRQFRYVSAGGPETLDPDIASGVRYLTRDEREPIDPEELAKDSSLERIELTDPLAGASGYYTLGLIDQYKAASGAAGWNDFSWISNAARQSLQGAAGISVPRRQFVLKMIGLYLLVIVVVNWLVFRLLGRVEWAWFAVPVIAIAWGVMVIWLAQLDIGFARAQIELDVLEIQPGYARGHLTRYTALYSSLSSDYDVRFDDPSAVALPFSTDRVRLAGQGSAEVTLAGVTKRDLADYPVPSNSTGMIHGEQMHDLTGELIFREGNESSATLANHTNLTLSGAAVLRRRPVSRGRTQAEEVAWLGDVAPGESVELTFVPRSKSPMTANRDRQPLTSSAGAPGALNLRKVLDCVENHQALAEGEVRLVAWSDAAVGTLQVNPKTAQSRSATVIVGHLTYGSLATPVKDENLRPLSTLRIDSF